MDVEILHNLVKKNFKSCELSNFGNAEVDIIEYENQKFIVRIKKDNPYSIPHNFFALKLFSKLNISPKPILLNENYSIETFLEGKQINRFKEDQIRQLIKTLNILHKEKLNKCGYLNSHFKDWKSYVKNHLILNFEKKFIKKYPQGNNILLYALRNIPECNDFVFLHGDLNEGNILFEKNKAFLFDFESCFYGEKEYDIGYLNFRMNFNEDELKLFKGYDKNKILYYCLIILIRKVALANEKQFPKRVKLLEKIFVKLLD